MDKAKAIIKRACIFTVGGIELRFLKYHFYTNYDVIVSLRYNTKKLPRLNRGSNQKTIYYLIRKFYQLQLSCFFALNYSNQVSSASILLSYYYLACICCSCFDHSSKHIGYN